MTVEKIMIDPSNANDPILKKIAKLNKRLTQDAEPIPDFVDPSGFVDMGLAILKEHGNLKLIGPTGVGKTLLARVLADKLGATYHDMQMTMDTQSFNLVSEVRMVSGNTVVQLGVVARWLLDPEPSLLFLDEINFSMAGVLSLLHATTDDRRHLYVPDLGTTIARDTNKYLVIAFNPAERAEYVGTNMLNIAFSRRFEGFNMTYLPERKEAQMLKKRGLSHGAASKLTQIAAFSRTAYLAGKLITPITLGNLKAWADLIINQGVTIDTIKTLVYGLYPEKQHGLVDKVWGGEQLI